VASDQGGQYGSIAHLDKNYLLMPLIFLSAS